MTENGIHIFPLKMRMPGDGNPAAVNVPLMAAVIETADDLILLDTGFPGENDLFDQLNLLHFFPADFTIVINTHVHIDHVGNNFAFSNARIVVSRADYEYSKEFSHAMLESPDIIATLTEYFPHSNSRRIEASAGYLYRMIKKFWRENILGSPEQIEWIEEAPTLPEYLTLIHTPGHTPGHYSIHVRGQSTSFLFAGDAMPSRLFWKRRLQELTPRYSSELFAASKIKLENFNGIILGGHDLPFHTDDLSYIKSKSLKI